MSLNARSSSKKDNSSMPGNSPRVITSAFHQRYQLILPGGGGAHASAIRVDIADPAEAARFVRNHFSASDSLWRSVIRQHFSDIAHGSLLGNALYTQVGRLLATNRIQLSRLPQLKKTMLAKDGKGKAYRFIKGPDPLPAENTAPLAFTDEKAIDAVLDKAQVEDGFWASVLEDSGTYPNGQYIRAGEHKSIVKKKLQSGELRAYELPYTPAAPKSVTELVSGAGPGSRPAPLAPAAALGWIELKLIYDDDTPIANEAFWVRDRDGNEFSGKTNEKGIAKIQDLAQGYCDIKFPELDGWYQ